MHGNTNNEAVSEMLQCLVAAPRHIDILSLELCVAHVNAGPITQQVNLGLWPLWVSMLEIKNIIYQVAPKKLFK